MLRELEQARAANRDDQQQAVPTGLAEPVLLCVLNYIYTGKCEVPPAFLDHVAVAARQFGIPELEELVADAWCEPHNLNQTASDERSAGSQANAQPASTLAPLSQRVCVERKGSWGCGQEVGTTAESSTAAELVK